MKEIKPIEWRGNILKVLDQTALPGTKKYIQCRNYRDVAKAIKEMKLRGAPLIGVAAAIAIAIEADKFRGTNSRKLFGDLNKAGGALVKTRPTAVNLKWAVKRMLDTAEFHKNRKINTLKSIISAEAKKIFNEDIENNRAIGRFGVELIRDKDVVLTHCNAGALATAGYGTALGVIRAAVERKKKITVYADETRPYLQGARLTVFELSEMKVPHYLITDSMAGYFMRKGEIDIVIVGADRIAANGDVANKIGTYMLAVLAHANNIPFYVAAPSNTLDLNIESGSGIPIEERDANEVKKLAGKDITGKKTKARHPAFDITPSKYISALITEEGIIRAPFAANIEKLFSKREVVASL